MTQDPRHERLSTLFAAACELPPEERGAFLRRACAGDEALLQEVLELLERDASSAGPIPPSPPRGPGSGGDSSPSKELMERLSAHRPQSSRYQLLGEIARGGMGAILKVWDADLRRHLAMKVILGRSPESPSGETPAVEARVLERFLEEAQITGQLDHPGIVPVHELGLDDAGRVFFTMRLVKGKDLKAILALARAGAEGWSQTRVVGVLLKACEAMAFAHSRGVIHRDIKPANLMVGSFGETYVMDWGLGRVLEREDAHDLRLRAPAPADASAVRTYRAPEATGVEEQLMTRDGDVIGTPAYMSPEQARGDAGRMGPASDVYSLGAILYELLAGTRPFHEKRSGLRAVDVWQRLLDGPPAPVQQLARSAPPELIAICDKAMARDPARRYPHAGEMAEDLRAYLENRVVRAHRTGPLVELRKWIGRNRLAAAALAAIVVVTASAGFVVAGREQARRREVERGADANLAGRLLAEAEGLWPIGAAGRARAERWNEEVRGLLERAPGHRVALERFEVEHSAAPRIEERHDDFEILRLESLRDQLMALQEEGKARDLDVIAREVALLGPQIERLRAEQALLPTWRYADPGLARVRGELLAIAGAARSLQRPAGWIDVVAERSRALDVALREAEDAWREAREAIADPRRSPAYRGLSLAPQAGLVPLGPDPVSGLWEFWHVASGARPERAADGALRVDEGTGIVLVLVPGGELLVGAQADDPERPNHLDPSLHHPEDPTEVRSNEGPVHQVGLAPYFLAKHELTQGQWQRLAGSNPSKFSAGLQNRGEPRISRAHPVECVSWDEAHERLAHWGLALPTEAQWERAARAGGDGPFWGPDGSFASIAEQVNLADLAYARRAGEAAVPLDDGYGVHSPVDAFPANPFGFHGITGNVREWCLDWFCEQYDRAVEVVAGTGEHVPTLAAGKAARGGSYASGPSHLRVSRRVEYVPGTVLEDLGVRPARALDPEGTPP